MAELSGVPRPKKRKIQTIFLGSFNGIGSQSASASADTLGNGAPPANASPLLALSSSADPTRPSSSSSSVPTPTNAQFSPIRRILSPICHRLDERRTERQTEEEQKVAHAKWTNNGENGGEKTLLTNHSQLSADEGHSSLNASATFAANGDERPPLPQLTLSLDSGAKLRKVPQMHSSHKGLELPAPQAQKEMEIRLKLGPSAQIDRIVVQNSLSNKRTLKGARVVAKFGRDTKWQHIVPSPVLLIHSNRVWTVLCLEDRSLVVLLAQSGRVAFSLLTPAVLSLVQLRDNFCFAVGTDATAQLWDLGRSQSLFRASVRSLFGYSPDAPRVVDTFVSSNGLPVIVLSNGDAFVFSLSLHSWLSLQIGREFVAAKLSSVQSVAKVLPDGLIAALLKASKSENSANFFPPQRMEIAEAKEESEIEMLLRMTRELASWEEFRFLTVIYAQLLLTRGKRVKLVEFLAELRSLSQTHNEFSLSTIAADLRPLLVQKGQQDTEFEEFLLAGGAGKGVETAKGSVGRTTTDAGTYNATDRSLLSLLTLAPHRLNDDEMINNGPSMGRSAHLML